MSNFKAAIIPVTAFQQNCTLIWCSETMKGALIDPGGDVPRILEAVKDTGVSVEKVWLTHGHMDHAGGADEVRETLGCVVEGPHMDDQFLLDTLVESSARYGIPNARNLKPDAWLKDGDTVSVGTLTFDVLHCPGHSPGSVVFMSRDERLAFVGDVLFQGSIGRTDLPRGDHPTLIRSIMQKLFPLGDDVAFVCGHGPMSTIGEERASNPFLT